MMHWEGRFNALVRRLIEISDSPDLSIDRLFAYDLVARAHEKDIRQSKEAMLAAEGAG
jgi:hypothetical protein